MQGERRALDLGDGTWWADVRGLARIATGRDAGKLRGKRGTAPADLEVPRPVNVRKAPRPMPPTQTTTSAPRDVNPFPDLPAAVEPPPPDAPAPKGPPEAPPSAAPPPSPPLAIDEDARPSAPPVDPSARVRMDQASAAILASCAGFVLTRVAPAMHEGASHIPLQDDEREQLGAALAMVFERRFQVVLAVGDDLVALVAVSGLILAKRDAAARLELEAKASKEGNETP